MNYFNFAGSILEGEYLYQSKLHDGTIVYKFKDKNGKEYNCGERGYRAPYSKEQMASLKDLLNDISKRRGIPYDENHIVAHGSLYQGNHADPVVGFEWSEIGLTNKYGPSPKGKFTQIPNPSSVSNKIA